MSARSNAAPMRSGSARAGRRAPRARAAGTGRTRARAAARRRRRRARVGRQRQDARAGLQSRDQRRERPAAEREQACTSCSAQPSRAQASENADGAGRQSVSAAGTSRPARLPTPKQYGSPDASTATGRGRRRQDAGTPPRSGCGQASRSPRISRSASARCRAPPDHQLGVADSGPRRAAQAVDAVLADAHDGEPGDIGRRPVVSFGANQRSPARVRAGSDPRRHHRGVSPGPRPCRPSGLSQPTLSLPAAPGARAAADPARVGGFGGVDGLVAYLRASRTDALDRRDAPVRRADDAAMRPKRPASPGCRCSRSSARLAAGAGRPLDGGGRHGGSRRRARPAPRRVLLTVGQQELAPFAAAPWHHYLIRSVDPPRPSPAAGRRGASPRAARSRGRRAPAAARRSGSRCW